MSIRFILINTESYIHNNTHFDDSPAHYKSPSVC
jgi:hypothetical protein